MTLAAFDLSLAATGFATYGGQLLYGTLRPPAGMVDCERLDWIRQKVASHCVGVELVVMEGISFGSNDPSAQERAGLAWTVRLTLWRAGTPYVLVSPSSLKKFIVGSGGGKKDPVTGEKIKITKDLVIKELYKRFGHDVNDNNQADAIGLLYVGRALLGDWAPTIEPQREVVAMLRKSNRASLERVGVTA